MDMSYDSTASQVVLVSGCLLCAIQGSCHYKVFYGIKLDYMMISLVSLFQIVSTQQLLLRSP